MSQFAGGSGNAVRGPTMRDVAIAAGVSKALVSIIFRGAPGASEQTRARVLKVAEEIGYRTNRTASLLASRRTKHLGVTMSIRSAFHAELVEGIQAAADRAGYEIVLSTVTATHDERRAVNTLLEFRCESVILLGSDLPQQELHDLADALPVILVGRRLPLGNLDVVRSADDHGQALVVDHLVGRGHREIVHVDGGRHPIATDRRRGYRNAMRRHGLAAFVQTVPGGTQEDDGRRAVELLLEEGARPTAVTAFNDHCAVGVIDALSRAGIAVPQQCSVTGYDNSLIAQFAAVDLTTVSQESAIQAEWAVRAAVERLEGTREQPRESVLEPRLVIRGSTGAAPVRSDPPNPGTP
jgi:DNA-binding LacI/PurR family transcriptional regulator